jgi:hypothetical protein
MSSCPPGFDPSNQDQGVMCYEEQTGKLFTPAAAWLKYNGTTGPGNPIIKGITPSQPTAPATGAFGDARDLTPNEVGLLRSNTNLALIDPNLKQWFQEQGFPNFVEPADMDRTGNLITLGPAGAYQEIEALALLAYFVKCSKTPEGMKSIERIILKYLDSMSDIISSMQASSAANWWTAMMNQYQQTSILQRMGLISPYDAERTKMFLDNKFGQILDKSYFGDIVSGVTTLVQGSSIKTKGGTEAEGLGILGALPFHLEKTVGVK